MDPQTVAQVAKSVPEAPRFEKAIVYSDFTHMALSRTNPAGYDGSTTIYFKSEAGGTYTGSGVVHITDEHDHDDGESGVTIVTGSQFAEASSNLEGELGVMQDDTPGVDTPYERDGDDNVVKLQDKLPPQEGEVDIGDLRFGSVKFDEIEPSDLNQPTSIGQQNAASVATAEMLRTDMDPVISDVKSLPETVLTISLNATERDDVNRRLRPLVAMQKRLPFCAVRNADLARMMLGISASEDVEGRLSEVYPGLPPDAIEELAQGMPDNLGDLWVPVTLRNISVDTQPGAAGLYQVHVVMYFANILPYVPRMQFWQDTKSAVQWARYLSLRSMQGAEVGGNPSERAGGRKVTTPQGNVITATPPENMGEKQTSSPYESYPFKKMYRGLLEEFLPRQSGGAYDTLKQQEKFGQLRPIGHAAGNTPVYEPGYPISDPDRVFETYDSASLIGFQYVTVSQEQTPQARLQRVLSNYEDRINLAEELDSAVRLADLDKDQVRGLEDAGKVTPVLLGPGRDVAKIMLSVNQTADAFREVTSDVMSKLQGGSTRDDLVSNISEYGVEIDREGLSLDSQTYEAEPTGAALLEGELSENEMAGEMMTHASLFDRGGVAEFQVPDRRFEDVYVKFSDRLSELQRGILKAFVKMIERMGKQSEWEGYGEPDHLIWSWWFDKFINAKIREYAENQNIELEGEPRQIPDEEIPSWASPQTNEITYYRGGFDEWVPEGFGPYMLTYDFLSELMKEVDDWTRATHPDTAVRAREDLEALREQVERLSSRAYEAVENADSSIKQALKDQAEETSGYLTLENASVENLRMRFSNNFGDREWKAYPQPVTQHLGANNAEITLEFTTNNQLLLDQLGELKRSQEALAEERKTEDVVPPLMTIENPGNILRAHGIRTVAYRSHSVNMAESRPGYYKVRLELIQDEETLVRHEQFRRSGGTNDGRVKMAKATAPLTIPVKGIHGDTDGYTPDGPIAVYDFLRAIFGEEEFPKERERSDKFSDERAADQSVVEESAYDWDVIEDVRDRTVESANIRYVPESQREGVVFTADFRWRGEDGQVRRRKDVDVTEFFGPIASFLDRASREFDQDQFRETVQRVEGVLSTAGPRIGLFMSWWRLAKARLIERRADTNQDGAPSAQEVRENPDEHEDWEIQEETVSARPGMGVGRREGVFRRDNVTFSDDVTEIVSTFAHGDDLDGTASGDFVSFSARTYLLNASELTSILFTTGQTYGLYNGWLTENSHSPAVDADAVEKRASNVHRSIIEQQDTLPSAYTDFLIPDLRDSQQDGVNIFAPDFPFGPGTEELHEDLHFENYNVADSMRQASAVQMATIGFNTIDDYIGSDERYQNDNVTRLETVFNRAIENLNEESNADIMEKAPFDKQDGSYFQGMYEEMQSKREAFRGELNDRIRTKDLVQALQISKTIEYVTQIMELAASPDDRQVQVGDTEELDSNIQGHVDELFRKIENGEGMNFSNVDLAEVSSSYENVSRVNGSAWLAKKRKELVRMYEADPEVLQDYLGFYDRFTEPRRAKLKQKARESWRGWEGMRKAFPSYLLLLTGKLGTGLTEVLADRFSWTAVQQIEIRNMAANAGQQCDLVLSNMRKRIVGHSGRSTPTDTPGQSVFDARKKIEPGTHMHVYTGYGPDAEHLKPFMGRVTGVNVGPITQVQLSSYSTTLNNPPNGGQGFYVDGWDGQQSLTEAILYTISQTSGLEGLGRRAPGAATDCDGGAPRILLGGDGGITSLANNSYLFCSRPPVRQLLSSALWP